MKDIAKVGQKGCRRTDTLNDECEDHALRACIVSIVIHTLVDNKYVFERAAHYPDTHPLIM